jgi:predicted phosphoadenosine phosphosulfate sulfurtransferase
MNVHEATLKRLKVVFDDFDNVLVAFSCGKDSGIVLNMAYDYAKQTNQLHKLSFYYEDYEADYKYTHEYADRMFKYIDVEKKYWLCLPITAACAVSMYENRWHPWKKEQEKIWVRSMPKYDYVVNQDNCPFPFTPGIKGFDTRIYFSEWFAEQYGSTAVLIGIRADESLTRRAIFTSQHRRYMHKSLVWSKTISKSICNFYPIYDWKTADIWVANAKFKWDYNKIYDLYYQAGLTIDQMRVASPFHQSGIVNLHLFRTIDPDSWGKMVGRVNGCNFGGIYGSTSAMGWKKIVKPDHFTWRQYADFLISTLPVKVKKKLIHHLERYQKTWEEKGYGRNPYVIKQMEQEGIILEKTGQVSKLCTKPGVYEIVKIKSGIPDDTKITNFRRCPNWKAVCITIMKNDFALTYLSCSRTKDQEWLKLKGLAKYKVLQAKKRKESKDE